MYTIKINGQLRELDFSDGNEIHLDPFSGWGVFDVIGKKTYTSEVKILDTNCIISISKSFTNGKTDIHISDCRTYKTICSLSNLEELKSSQST